MRAASVGDLISELAGVGLTLVSSPEGRHLAVRTPVLHDGPLHPTREGLLLLAGHAPDSPLVPGILEEAVDAGFRAVAIKLHDQPPDALAAIADQTGIALLGVADQLDWLHLAGMLGTVLDTAAQRDLPGPETAVGDLFGLANAIAGAVGGATAIEDLQQRVLAYSTIAGQDLDDDRREGILGRQVPDLPENHEQYRQLYSSRTVQRFAPIPPALGRIAIAVRAANDVLGSIWVVDPPGGLGADVDGPLVAAAEIAALHLLRARSAEDLARHQRSEIVRGLLSGELAIAQAVDRLGLAADGPFVVLAFAPAPGTDTPASRIAELLTLRLEARLGTVATCAMAGTVYVLASGGRVPDAPRLLEWCRELVSGSASPRPQLVCATGRVVTDPALITTSRHDTDGVLALLRAGGGVVASTHELADQLALTRLADVVDRDPDTGSAPGRAMLAHDAQHGTAYAPVMLAWLDLARDVGACAQALSVHPNTVRYRIRRARALFGLDPADADQMLLLWLTLRVHDTAGCSPHRKA